MTTVITGSPQPGPQPGPQPQPRPAPEPPPVLAPYAPGPYAPGTAPRWRVDAVRPQDGAALAELFARCSAETVRLRFFGQPRELPRSYLDAMLAGRPESHDAVVAYPQGPGVPESLAEHGGWTGPVGLGSLAAARGGADPDVYPCPVGELGLLVVDGWQRLGAGAAMLDALFDRARTRGVRLVSASVLPGRRALLGALGRRLQPVRMTRDIDALTGVYRLGPERRTEAGNGGRGQDGPGERGHGERGPGERRHGRG
ncbi:hypothetical protein OG896_20950 [Streptomyces sp. NBC_00669]|uniref:GNAT family N-acetyltransferase n=1 Tax=Streptomyces sp. NBC_00669 TaxID=2976011 RepID=UPI002E2FFC53|nr:hypothetical protein [Streptomyces sp. NBC_00669]